MDNTKSEINILTEEECLKIIRTSFHIKQSANIYLKFWKIEHASKELVGFMGEYFRLNVVFELEDAINTQSISYFIKSVPISSKCYREECLRKGFFPKETRIYTEILPNIQKYAYFKLFPECYYTRDDIMVLEDLSAKENASMKHVDSRTGFTLAHCKIVLAHLAMLHAASIAWETKEKVNIGEKFHNILTEFQLTMRNEWYVTGIKGIEFLINYHSVCENPTVKKFVVEKLKEASENIEILTVPSSNHQNVFCHRDSWSQNILFKYNESGEPINCCLVDFQLSRYCRPAIDVLFFLYVSTSLKQRELIYDECLDYYYKHLTENLQILQLSKKLITKEDFLRDCEQVKFPVLILWTICEPLMKMPKGVLHKMRAEGPEKFDHYMNKDRRDFFLKLMAMDTQYKDIIMNPINELVKHLLHNKPIA